MVLIDVSLLGLATAVMAGAISFLSPCVLPLVPGYLSYVAGGADGMVGDAKARQLRVLGPALPAVKRVSAQRTGRAAVAVGSLFRRERRLASRAGMCARM